MADLAKKGKYMQAEECRANIEIMKKQLGSKKLCAVKAKQKAEIKEVKGYLKDDLETFKA